MTANLCLKLFAAMGVRDVSMADIDMAHRLPSRRRLTDGTGTQANRLKPVICKFTRRLAREKVLAKRNVSRVKPEDLGLRTADNNNHLPVFEHLTPRLQEGVLAFERLSTAYFFPANGREGHVT